VEDEIGAQSISWLMTASVRSAFRRLDRLQRAEARGVIMSAKRGRELRLLRNAIAHDYLIESDGRVLRESPAPAGRRIYSSWSP